jgi:hypothetical protein
MPRKQNISGLVPGETPVPESMCTILSLFLIGIYNVRTTTMDDAERSKIQMGR